MNVNPVVMKEKQVDVSKSQIAEFEKYFCEQDAASLTFTLKQIENLVRIGIIPKKLGIWFFENKKKLNMNLYSYFKNKTSELVIQNNNNEMSVPDDLWKSAQLLKLLIDNRGLLDCADEELKCQLFNNVDHASEFGASKVIMDRIFYLEELIRKSKLVLIAPGEWILSSRIPDSRMEYEPVISQDYKGGAGLIGLQYSFAATTKEEAEKLCNFYKKEMIERGILTYLMFYKIANDKKSFYYKVRLTEIMQQTLGRERKSAFTQQEKREFWRTVNLIERTKLTIEFSPKGKNEKCEKILLQPNLIAIVAKASSQNNPPRLVIVSMPNLAQLKEKIMHATSFTNSTLKLKPTRRVNLAAIIQTRQAQRRGQTLTFSEEMLIEKSGLQRTAHSNSRVAVKRLKSDLDKLKGEGIIQGWGKTENGSYTIVPRKCKKED